MKIWKAKLLLFYTDKDKWDTRFDFELQPEDYKVNEKFNEWTRSVGWIQYSIPMNMVVENQAYEGYVVRQGFDHELDSKELKELENEMRELLIKRLHHDKDQYLITLNNKLRAIRE